LWHVDRARGSSVVAVCGSVVVAVAQADRGVARPSCAASPRERVGTSSTIMNRGAARQPLSPALQSSASAPDLEARRPRRDHHSADATRAPTPSRP
jgi:hypothetical protein